MASPVETGGDWIREDSPTFNRRIANHIPRLLEILFAIGYNKTLLISDRREGK
jgi:hypothetical protein